MKAISISMFLFKEIEGDSCDWCRFFVTINGSLDCKEKHDQYHVVMSRPMRRSVYTPFHLKFWFWPFDEKPTDRKMNKNTIIIMKKKQKTPKKEEDKKKKHQTQS